MVVSFSSQQDKVQGGILVLWEKLGASHVTCAQAGTARRRSCAKVSDPMFFHVLSRNGSSGLTMEWTESMLKMLVASRVARVVR